MYEQERVFVRLQQRVLQEPSILVCFVSGSFGRRSQDAYSDLDVALVYRDTNARDVAFAERRAFAQSVMTYVASRSFDAHHVRPFFHIALYANGAKVDYRFEAMDSLSPNPWDRELRLLKDHQSWGMKYQEACARLPFPQPAISVSQLAEMDDRFWVMFWDTFRQIQRGSYDKPFEVYIQLFSLTLQPLMSFLPSSDPARRALNNAFFGQDSAATLDHLRELLQHYLALRAALVRRFDLSFAADTRFEESILNLVQRARVNR